MQGENEEKVSATRVCNDTHTRVVIRVCMGEREGTYACTYLYAYAYLGSFGAWESWYLPSRVADGRSTKWYIYLACKSSALARVLPPIFLAFLGLFQDTKV